MSTGLRSSSRKRSQQYPDPKFLQGLAPVSNETLASVDKMSKPEGRPGQQRDLTKDAIDDIYADGRPYRGAAKLENKVAWISGGDSGIGKSTAILFAIEGARAVSLVYLPSEQQDAEDTKDYISVKAPNCEVQLTAVDLKTEDNCYKAINNCVREFGRIDVLVNNSAQQLENTDISTLDTRQWLDCFDLNIHSYFHCCKAAIPYMPRGSSIINMCSINAFVGRPDLLDYTSTKGAIVAFTRGLSNQILADKQIRVNSIAPGPIWTPLIPSTFSKENVKGISSPPIGRPGMPVEVATCCVFLLVLLKIHPTSLATRSIRTAAPSLLELSLSRMATAPALSSATPLHTHISDNTEPSNDADLAFNDLFDIQETVSEIQQRNFQCVALQFPDEMLRDSVKVYRSLRKLLAKEIKLFVLADTTYGSCCVDEVAAEHVNADAIVHYGHSCLSPPSRLPTLLVFTKRKLDVVQAVSDLAVHFRDASSLKLVYDVAYAWCIDSLRDHLADALKCRITCKSISKTAFLDLHNSHSRLSGTDDHDTHQPDTANPHSEDDTACRDQDKPDSILYIGTTSLKLTNMAMHNPSAKIFTYDPSTSGIDEPNVSSNRLLMRRYAAIQKAKDADVFGIVVGTLGVFSFLPLVNQLRQRLRAKQKKVYTICVGKPTPTKLANYQEIECFVLVACPENSLLLTGPDSTKDFYRPIITPWELDVALDHAEWQAGWTLDWQQTQDRPTPDILPAEDTQFSDTTGKMRTVRKFYAKNDPLSMSNQISSLALTTNGVTNRQVAQLLGSAAGEHISSLEYRGLDPRYDQDAARPMEQGRTGIASSYASEKGQ